MKPLLLAFVALALVVAILLTTWAGGGAERREAANALTLNGARSALAETAQRPDDFELPLDAGRQSIEPEPGLASQNPSANQASSDSHCPTSKVFGRVTDSAGRPPPEFDAAQLELHFAASDPRHPGDNVKRIGQTKSEWMTIPPSGEFESSNLMHGTWTAICRIDGCAPTRTSIVITGDEPRMRHDIVLGYRVVSLSLHDDAGRSFVSSLRASGLALDAGLVPFVSKVQPVIGEYSRATGVLALRSHVLGDGITDPWCELLFESGERCWVGLELGNATLAFEEVPLGVEDVTLVIPNARLHHSLGALEFQIVDAIDSHLLNSAFVRLSSVGLSLFLSAKDGHVSFDAVVAGNVLASVSSPGYANWGESITVTAGQRSKIEVRLEREVTISGTVTDQKGHPAIVWVSAVHPIPETRETLNCGTVMSDPDGSFRIVGLAHLDYRLTTGSVTDPLDSRMHLPVEHPESVDARHGSVSGLVIVHSERPDEIIWDDKPGPGKKN